MKGEKTDRKKEKEKIVQRHTSLAGNGGRGGKKTLKPGGTEKRSHTAATADDTNFFLNVDVLEEKQKKAL